jgi:hypothetical protein
MTRRPIAIALAMLSVACSDPAAPAPIAGRYTLRLIGGTPLPVFRAEWRVDDVPPARTYRETMVGGKLVALDSAADTLHLMLRLEVTPDGEATVSNDAVYAVRFKLRGDQLCTTDAWYDVGPACVDPQPVRRHGDSLFVRLTVPPDLAPVEYLFVREGT